MQLRSPVDSEAIIANAQTIGPVIEEEADKFAKERRLTDDAIALMRRAGLFRIAFPRAWGGPEMDILDQCEVMETLGYHDASAAWVAMVGSDSGHYAARIDETRSPRSLPKPRSAYIRCDCPDGAGTYRRQRIEGQRAMEFWQRLPACRPPGWRLRSV